MHIDAPSLERWTIAALLTLLIALLIAAGVSALHLPCLLYTSRCV